MRIAVARVCASTGSSAAPWFAAKLRTSGLAPAAWITLNLRQPRHQPQLPHLAESLAQRRAIPQIAARNNQMVGHIPVERFGNLKCRRLLALQAGRDSRSSADKSAPASRSPSARAGSRRNRSCTWQRDRAVIHRLRQLAPRNFSVGNQHQAAQPGARRISRHCGRRVARRRARNPLKSALPRHAHRRSHARVFERTRRIHALVLGKKLVDSQRLCRRAANDRAAYCPRAAKPRCQSYPESAATRGSATRPTDRELPTSSAAPSTATSARRDWAGRALRAGSSRDIPPQTDLRKSAQRKSGCASAPAIRLRIQNSVTGANCRSYLLLAYQCTAEFRCGWNGR